MLARITTATQHSDHPGRRQLLKGMIGGASLAMLGVGCSQETSSVAPAAKLKLADIQVPPGAVALDEGQLTEALALLSNELSIDLHCHPGAFFFNGFNDVHPSMAAMGETAGFEARTVADMAAGGLSAAMFATVADGPLIAAGKQGLYAHREFKPGEAYGEHKRQLALLHAMVETNPILKISNSTELANAKATGKVGAFFATEGGDFLDQQGERIAEAYADGIRSIGLVHYHINDIGDIQTAQPHHGGLTDFGKEAVTEMNRLGIIVDLAHATFATTAAAAEQSSKPILVSHSFLADKNTQNPRLLSVDHARVVAATGGLIGGWPSGIGNPDFPAFVNRLLALVDLVGIDHVGLGTDMDANYKPVMSNYRQLPYLAGTLKSHGMSDEEIIKLLGGNFLRLLSEVAV